MYVLWLKLNDALIFTSDGQTLLDSMKISVVEFSNEGYKIRKFLAKNRHVQRKVLNFTNWCSGKV